MLDNFKGGVIPLKGKKRRILSNIQDHNLVSKDYYQHHLNVNKLTDSVSKLFLGEQKPIGAKSDDTKPIDTKPIDTKPDDTKPIDTKPIGAKSDDTKPIDTKPDDIANDLTKRMANLWKRKVVQKMKIDPVKFSTRIRKQTNFFDPSADDKVKKIQSQATSRKSKSSKHITPSQKSKKKTNQQALVSNQNNKLGEKPLSQHSSQPRSPSQSQPRSPYQSQPRSQHRFLSKSVRSHDKKESSTEIANQLSNIFEDLSKVLYKINEKRGLHEIDEPSMKKKQRTVKKDV